MSKKGRPPPPPKPEELIEILDKKFETFKSEMLEALEGKSNEISEIKESIKEENSIIKDQIEEFKNIFESYKTDVDAKFSKIEENQITALLEQKKDLNNILNNNIGQLNSYIGMLNLLNKSSIIQFPSGLLNLKAFVYWHNLKSN